jgi:hypothetical protein
LTEQLTDSIRWRDREFSIAGTSGGPRFDPAEHGLEVSWLSSACWRGFLCLYAVDAGELVLTELRVGTETPPPPPLFGVLAEPAFATSFVYRGLHAPVPFTGGMQLGGGDIHTEHVSRGQSPFYIYDEFHELLFESGRLTSHRDLSAGLAEVRPAERSREAPEEYWQWLRSTFDRSYLGPG